MFWTTVTSQTSSEKSGRTDIQSNRLLCLAQERDSQKGRTRFRVFTHGVIIIHFSSDLLLRAHFSEAFLDDQMKSLVAPEFFMDRVTEGAEGVFCDERQLTSKSVKAKASS